jgi:hypothetical protein
MDCLGVWSGKQFYFLMQVRIKNNSFNNSAVSLLFASFVTISGQGESREWTPPFGIWTFSTTLPTTVRMTKSHIVQTSSSIRSVCDEKCCKCDIYKSRVECISSHHCNVRKNFDQTYFILKTCS